MTERSRHRLCVLYITEAKFVYSYTCSSLSALSRTQLIHSPKGLCNLATGGLGKLWPSMSSMTMEHYASQGAPGLS
jgi:hypothetical protein